MKWTSFLIFLLIPFWGSSQIITTVAGNGICGNTGDGGSATAAKITLPTSGIFDQQGNYYFTTGSTGCTIRKISKCGTITTVAGTTGHCGFGGDNGPATAAKLDQPTSVAIDTIGNLYISDEANNRIRKVDTAGIITTIAGNGTLAFGGDGGLATAATLLGAYWVLVDDTGNIIDVESNRIRKINPAGIIYTIVGTGSPTYGGDGGPANLAAIQPESAFLDASNNLYIADLYNYRVRYVNAMTDIITTVAGNGTPGYCCDGAPATNANINPFVVAVDTAGNLFIGDEHARICKVGSAGIISTYVGTGTAGYSGDNGPATAAEISVAEGLVFDAYGNLFLADENNCRIREVIINPPLIPIVTVTTSPNDTVCTGTSVTFTAAVSGATTSFNYQWLVNGSAVSGGTSATYTYSPANGDSICCTISVTGQCAIISSNTIYMVASPPATPTISLIATTPDLIGSTVTVNATVAGASSSYSINWYNNGMLFSTTSTPSTTFIKDTGIDNIMATVIPSPLGTLPACYDSTTSSIFSISATTGISNIASPPLNIYPNPAHDVLHIDNVSPQTSYSLLSMVGTVLQKDILHTGNNSITIQSFPPGIYILEITNPTGAKTITKIVKQ